MNGWEKNGKQFKIEFYVTLYFSVPNHIVGCFVLKSWIFSVLILLDKLLFSFSFSQEMRWTSEHDVMFLREVLVHEPWEQKYESQEWGKVWEKTAESLKGLNAVCELYFKVTQWSVRDRYKLLVDNFKKREQEEAVASGFSREETESDIALVDIIERFKEADEMHKKQTDEKKSKHEADTHKAAEMRRRSLGTFFESNARLRNDPVVKISRNTGSETVQYLREWIET